MEIRGKVYCLFEQSGTFKNEFIKLGIPAEDFDIQDNFGQTDHKIDLFAEIEKAYTGGGISIFDAVTPDDLIIAFFPCIYFSCMSQMLISYTHRNYVNYTPKQRIDAILERAANRELFFGRIVKLWGIAKIRGLRMIIENPWSEQTFLKQNFPANPSIIDANRLLRGDFFVKPTAYWFVGCEPTNQVTAQPQAKGKNICQIEPNRMPGLCNQERSMISTDYARNFICDFVLGKPQENTQLSLF
ncbi:MAG: hypothetical protein IK114_14080 [Fibrobacter sp.]|nr:hypothetical protein [Fibrobacter sp.]